MGYRLFRMPKKMIDKYPNAGIYSIAFYMIKYGKRYFVIFCQIKRGIFD